MPVYVSYTVTAGAQVTTRYTCAACGFTAGVLATGIGAAGSLLPRSERAAREAKKDATEDAMRSCEMAPCPQCGHRDLSAWRRRWIRAAFWPLLTFPIGALIIVWAGVRMTAEDIPAFLRLWGGIALIPEAIIALYFLVHLSAASKVEFLRADPSEGSAPEKRSSASAERMQFAGRICPVCQKKIVWVHDGAPCDECPAACHLDCLDAHQAEEHASGHPYRGPAGGR
jgi:hypothetical protein